MVSEAHPETNVIGTLIKLEGLTGEQLEIALDFMPGATKIGVLINPNNPANAFKWRELAAAALRVTLAPIEVRSADEVGPAFQMLLRERANIVLILGDVCNWREEVEDGGLISYGIDLRAASRHGAYYVDRDFEARSRPICRSSFRPSCNW